MLGLPTQLGAMGGPPGGGPPGGGARPFVHTGQGVGPPG